MRTAAVFAGALLVIGSVEALDAQAAARRPSPELLRLTNVRPASENMGRVGRATRARPTPVDLSRNEVFEGMTATSTFVLSPSEPVTENRGKLWFIDADVYAGSGLAPGGHATFGTRDRAAVQVRIYGAPGRTYVIDLRMEAFEEFGEDPPFRVATPDGTQGLFTNAAGHALIAFAPTTAGWYEFAIDPAGHSAFYSATVSVMQ